MPYTLFYHQCPEVAKRETRTITLLENSPWDLPAGDYSLVEMFCDEPGCDCRRVFLSVLFSRSERIEAVIAYGWETPNFYAKWMGGSSTSQITRELRGPILNSASPQSNNAPAILDMVSKLVLQDDAYIERIKSHYKMFRQQICGHKSPLRRKVEQIRAAKKRKKRKK